jgi:hypothetical protein
MHALVRAAVILVLAASAATTAHAGKSLTPAEKIAQLIKGKEFRGYDLRDKQDEISRRGRYLDRGWVGEDFPHRFEMKLAAENVTGRGVESIPKYTFYFSDDQKVLAVAAYVVTLKSDASFYPDLKERGWMRAAEKAGLRPTDFLGWSSTFGCVYTTQVPELFLAVEPNYEYVDKWGEPAPYWKSAVVVLRLFDGGLTNPNVHREWTTWASVAPALAAARAADDTSAMARTLGRRPMPLLGEAVDFYEAIVKTPGPNAALELFAQAEAADSWEARVEMLRRLRRHWRAVLEYDDARRVVDSALQRPFDVARRKTVLSLVAEKTMPAPSDGMPGYRLVRSLAIQLLFDPYPKTGQIVNAWIDRYTPHVPNLAEQSQGRIDFSDVNAFGYTPAGKLGATWDNHPGARDVMRLEFGPFDGSEVAYRRYEERTRAGGWVDATAEQLAEQERLDQDRGTVESIPERLAAIERELDRLDTMPLGTEVQGSAGEVRQERFVDAAGNTHVVETGPGIRNVYRVGVGADARAREERRKQLRAERERLKQMRGMKVPPGTVVNGKVWSPDGGNVVVKPGYMFDGLVRREVRLVGSRFTVRTEQAGDCHSFWETVNDGTTNEVIEMTKRFMETSNIFGLGDALARVVRLATVRAIELEMTSTDLPVEAMDAEMAWVRALLRTGDWPSKELRDYLFEEQKEREERDSRVSL